MLHNDLDACLVVEATLLLLRGSLICNTRNLLRRKSLVLHVNDLLYFLRLMFIVHRHPLLSWLPLSGSRTLQAVLNVGNADLLLLIRTGSGRRQEFLGRHQRVAR